MTTTSSHTQANRKCPVCVTFKTRDRRESKSPFTVLKHKTEEGEELVFFTPAAPAGGALLLQGIVWKGALQGPLAPKGWEVLGGSGCVFFPSHPAVPQQEGLVKEAFLTPPAPPKLTLQLLLNSPSLCTPSPPLCLSVVFPSPYLEPMWWRSTEPSSPQSSSFSCSSFFFIPIFSSSSFLFPPLSLLLWLHPLHHLHSTPAVQEVVWGRSRESPRCSSSPYSLPPLWLLLRAAPHRFTSSTICEEQMKTNPEDECVTMVTIVLKLVAKGNRRRQRDEEDRYTDIWSMISFMCNNDHHPHQPISLQYEVTDSALDHMVRWHHLTLQHNQWA